MNSPKLTARRPNREELRFPELLRALGDADLELLARHADVLRIPRGTRLARRDGSQTHLWFVLTGQARVRETDTGAHEVTGGTPRAQLPLIREGAQGECLCLTDIELLRVPLERLHGLIQGAAEQDSASRFLAERIYRDFQLALQAGALELPGMPTVAVRIARHIDSQDASAESIARIVQIDPSVTARLIQVANSPAFGARGRIDTCRDAILRLGQQSTRDLVTSFVLKGVFRARGNMVKARMRELWNHCAQVAALSHALAKRLPGFDPAQALLIGLVHDIGVIPILTAAHRYPGLAEDKVLLEEVIQRLRGECSAITLGAWGFAGEFTAAALEAEAWARDPRPQADYVDLLIIAQLHAYVGTARMTGMPRMDQVPAFRKLALGQLSPRMSLTLLDEAKKDIDAVRQMIA